MSDMPNNPLMAILAERYEAQIAQDKAYEDLTSVQPPPFETVRALAAERLKILDRTIEPGPGLDWMTDMLCYHKHLPTAHAPTNLDYQRLAEHAKTDFYAYRILRLAVFLDDDQEHLPALKEAALQLHLGLFPIPARPKGKSPFANHPRDTLIVREIKRLVSVGFTPTRNRAGSSSHSACDVIVAAMADIGQAMNYDAVEAIWRRRDELSTPRVLAEALAQRFGIEQLSEKLGG